MYSDEKVKALSHRLVEGVKQTFESKHFKNYLKSVSIFHNYSPRNVELIYLQRENATYVAEFEDWKKLGRYVRRGEKGISIFAPTKITVRQEKPVFDEYGNRKILPSGKPVTEEVEKTIIKFTVENVFDISQTEGEPLPALCNELQGAVSDFQKIFMAIQNLSPYKIIFEQLSGNTKGECRFPKQQIAIQLGMSDEQIIKTLIHEFAHATLHSNSTKAKEQKEIEAEGVAFIVSDFFGIDTSSYSFDYVSVWSQGMDREQLQVVLENIQNTASEIIYRIDAEMKSLEKVESIETQKLPERLSEAAKKSGKSVNEKEVIPDGKLIAQ